MGSSTSKPERTKRFLEELSRTLDFEITIKKLKMTRDQASDLLKALAESVVVPEKKGREARPVARRGGARGGYRIFVDGASRGNPGLAGAGAVIFDPVGRAVKKLKKYLGHATNNVAEYKALIMALEAARAMHIKEAEIFADSELVVKQLNGLYRVKSADLKPLYLTALGLLKALDTYTVAHIYRKDNSTADELANEAIDNR